MSKLNGEVSPYTLFDSIEISFSRWMKSAHYPESLYPFLYHFFSVGDFWIAVYKSRSAYRLVGYLPPELGIEPMDESNHMHNVYFIGSLQSCVDAFNIDVHRLVNFCKL